MIYRINGNDAIQAYGLYFKDGTLEELLKAPEAKEGYSFSWEDEDGTDRDLSQVYYESRELELPVFLWGKGLADFRVKLAALKAQLMSGQRINLDNMELGQRWKLLYRAMSDFEFSGGLAGDVVATFTLSLLDDYPTQTFQID
ncbi:hypothetical protein [Litoribacter populi]|uniref:hypothetical protein n=1 Tax=Litoribacter populi TaxID=2598460 RepID=UPI00117E96C9|nr:hypothetical protein [Litoribacter populi]